MLEAAASGASHVLKNHKPIRCALAFEVAVLASPAELRRAGICARRYRRKRNSRGSEFFRHEPPVVV